MKRLSKLMILLLTVLVTVIFFIGAFLCFSMTEDYGAPIDYLIIIILMYFVWIKLCDLFIKK